MENKSNSILVCVDTSYFLYFTLFSAISEYQKKCNLEFNLLIKDPEETDQQNLPDLLVSEDFRRILKNTTMHKCEVLDWYLKTQFQDMIDSADSIDFIFAQDDFLKNNFRKQLYPEYKAQRKLKKKAYDQYKIQNYVLNVIFKELQVEEKYGYRFLKVPNAEGDDIIASIVKNFSKDYMQTVIFASDRDYVQLHKYPNVYQMSLFGKEVKCEVAGEQVTPEEYLLAKIIVGDSSDNIGHVFDKVGEKRALNLVKDRSALNKRLNENQDAAKQYLLNQKLISFDNIPTELERQIVEQTNKNIFKNVVMNDELDFKTFMMM